MIGVSSGVLICALSVVNLSRRRKAARGDRVRATGDLGWGTIGKREPNLPFAWAAGVPRFGSLRKETAHGRFSPPTRSY